MTQPPAIGASALLRMTALPLSALAEGGDPELYARLAELESGTRAYRSRAAVVAEQLGDQLVPHPALSREQRGTALRVRRALHRGAPVPGAAAGLADLAANLLPDTDLADDLRELVTTDDSLRRAGQAVARSVAAQEERLLALPWQVLHDHPAGRHALRHGDVAIFQDIAARVARGEPWTTKRMRQRSEYLWRMLTRGSTRATPRGWLAHVATLAVTGGDPGDDAAPAGWPAGKVITVRDLAATEIVDNLDEFRTVRATSEALLADDGVSVAIAPLVWADAEQVAIWLVEGEQRTRLVAMRLRRTATLNAVWSLLSDGPRPVAQLVAALAGDDAARREAVRRFLAHLVKVGALQLGAAPRAVHTDWRPVDAFRHPVGGAPPAAAAGTAAPAGTATATAAATAMPAASPVTATFLDVYRRPAADLARSHAAELAELIGQALRVMALTDLDDPAPPPPLPPALTERPRSLLDIVADCVNEGVAVGTHGAHRHDWPTVRDPGSGYARLYRWIDDQLPKVASDARSGADAVRAGIDLDPVLDECGAPDQTIDWPMDFLLRPIAGRSDRSTSSNSSTPSPAGPIALLVDLAPAGVLDARFVTALRRLGSDVPHVPAYRRFLSRLSDRTGAPLVELLVPPMSSLAANAVRRPGYTGMWTGDPDPTGYFADSSEQPAAYLPLSAITLRAADGRVIAETEGRRIWPVVHTARVPRPPWDIVRGLLLRASPQMDRRAWRPLTWSLPAWPDREHVPRITVGGGRLVLTTAQWRVTRAELGHTDDPVIDRMRALLRLRHRLGLPRWVTVVADPHDEPIAVDLDSVRAPRALDRFPAQHEVLLVSELLPAPDQLPVDDEATPAGQHGLAELILRLPFDCAPDAAADVVAARVTRTSRPPAGGSAGPSGPAEYFAPQPEDGAAWTSSSRLSSGSTTSTA